MNTHRFLSLVAAILITAGQALIFVADTASSHADSIRRLQHHAGASAAIAAGRPAASAPV
jgi:hypothetical protein